MLKRARGNDADDAKQSLKSNRLLKKSFSNVMWMRIKFNARRS